MLSWYIGTFIFGAILILTSILFGGDKEIDKDIDLGSVDIDAEGDIDVDADGDGDAHFGHNLDDAGNIIWSPFLSLRFWTFFLGAFGLSGILMTQMGSTEPFVGISSSILGFAIGYGTALLFQYLKKNSVTLETSSASFVQQEGQVTLPIRIGKQGKIRIKINKEITDLIAITQDNRDIEIGSKVIIISMKDGVANVSQIENNNVKKTQKQMQSQQESI